MYAIITWYLAAAAFTLFICYSLFFMCDKSLVYEHLPRILAVSKRNKSPVLATFRYFFQVIDCKDLRFISDTDEGLPSGFQTVFFCHRISRGRVNFNKDVRFPLIHLIQSSFLLFESALISYTRFFTIILNLFTSFSWSMTLDIERRSMHPDGR